MQIHRHEIIDMKNIHMKFIDMKFMDMASQYTKDMTNHRHPRY